MSQAKSVIREMPRLGFEVSVRTVDLPVITQHFTHGEERHLGH